jgi:hypothetical protein
VACRDSVAQELKSYRLCAGSNPTPQFRGILLEAVYHGALHADIKLEHCDGHFDRTDDGVFELISEEISELREACVVRISFIFGSSQNNFVCFYYHHFSTAID